MLAAIKLFILESGRHPDLDTSRSFALVVVVPMAVTFTYFLGALSFGFAGDLAARQSTYPARMFTLPVTTGALAGWPMLYGTSAMAMLWLATRMLAVWPSNVTVPWIWPGLLAASLLAWTQALTWMPYPFPGMRVIVAVLWLGSIPAVALLALHYGTREPMMLAILGPHVPIAYLVARFAVARARRGGVPEWSGMVAPLARIADVVTRRGERFPSPASAQMWFEWRQFGRSLPALVAILLPFELALLLLAPVAKMSFVFYTLVGVLITPPFLAAFVAATVRTSNPAVSDPAGLSPFFATRPLSSAALIAAKLKATIVSTLVAWTLVLVAIPLALTLTNTWPAVLDRMNRTIAVFGTTRTAVLVLLLVGGLFATTWKQLMQSLYIGLTGRELLIKANVFLTLAFVTALGPVLQWIGETRGAVAALWDATPWILTVLVVVKMAAAVWIATRLHRSRLLSDRTLIIGVACWCVTVLALDALFVWFVDMPSYPNYLLALIAILAVPLARVSAAPLALDWNRHR